MPAVNGAIRAVVADDEPIARQALRELIAESSGIECVGEAADGIEAIEMVERLQPDLLFLDVRMPGATGVEVLERIGATTPVVFTTAFEDYALTAFELGALDYLRKPFGRSRFLKALERASQRLGVAQAREGEAHGTSVAERLAFARNVPSPLDRLFARVGAAVIPLKVDRVSRIEADGDYIAVHSEGRAYLLYLNLSEIAERLDPARFVRIHRSHIVNLDYVTAFVPHDPGRLEVRMKDGSRVVASRAGTRLLRSHYR